MADNIPLVDPAAVTITVPEPGTYGWADRPEKVRLRMIKASKHTQLVIGPIRKKTAHSAALKAMKELKKVKLSGSDKREIVVDLFLRGAEHAFRSIFPDEDSFRAFVRGMCNDAYAVLGKKVFGRSGCCCA